MAVNILLIVCALLIPAVTLFFALWLRLRPPQTINGLFGYRSRRAMRTDETWAFAQAYLAKLWIPTGAVLLLLSAALMVWLYGKGTDKLTTGLNVLSIAQLIVILATMPVVEHALKKTFDDNGKRK